jgi:hypothetical protein
MVMVALWSRDLHADPIEGMHTVTATPGMRAAAASEESAASTAKVAAEEEGAATKAASQSCPKQHYLHRPYIRKAVRKEVEDRAPRDAEGRPIDPNTGEPIEGTPDLGHKPGHEFWRERDQAEAEGLTQHEFNQKMNNPDYYQLEDPTSNQSHQYEQKK